MKSKTGKNMSRVESRDNYFLLPNSDRHNCFGCSQRNKSGLKMKFYTNKEVDLVVSWLSLPDQFCGWGNIVHGGIISTMLDEAMGWGALVILRKLVFTKSISVDFFNPVLTGKEIRVEGSVQKVNSEREAVLQGCIYSNDNICARSVSVASLFTLEYVRKIGVLDEEMLDGLERLMNQASRPR